MIILAIAIGTLILVVSIALSFGKNRWERETRDIRQRLEAAHIPIHSDKFSTREIDSLPLPVKRYFLAVLQDGQPMIRATTIEHEGSFTLSVTKVKWMRFTSTQRVITNRPGFDWDARITLMPGVDVLVHDAYVEGEGILHASLFGLHTVAEVRGIPEASEGEFLRYFAEAVWYPTALLPGRGVRWEAVDDISAKASIRDKNITLTMLIRFNREGLIESFRAESRARFVDGATVPTPWEGKLWRYEKHNGMFIPMEGEVAWVLPDGPRPYWRGSITKIRFEFME